MSLPAASILRLYADAEMGQYAARACLQRLPEIGRQYVLRLAVCGGVFPWVEMQSWSSNRRNDVDADKNTVNNSGGITGVCLEVIKSLQDMRSLRIIERLPPSIIAIERRSTLENINESFEDSNTAQSESDFEVKLTKDYYEAIQRSLSSLRPTPWPKANVNALLQEELKSDKKTSKKRRDTQPPTTDELEIFTQERWDSVLHYLVGSDSDEQGGAVLEPPENVIDLLLQTGLMQPDPDARHVSKERAPLVITSRGYEFMLQNLHAQVWQFMRQYLGTLEKLSKDRNNSNCNNILHEALLFVLSLSFCRVGDAYRASSLTKASRTFMGDIAQFGLVMVRKLGPNGVKVFFPTRVSVNLVAAASGVIGGSAAPTSASAQRALSNALSNPYPKNSSHLAIIVQTNFQLAAYTTSPLHVPMIGLFCRVDTCRRLPNMVFYKITRDSIKKALRLGIDAAQILSFLRTHAHPYLRQLSVNEKNDGPLPGNVQDQILLWEAECTRVVMDEVYTLQCKTDAEFEATKQYSIDNNAWGWGCEIKRRLMVKFNKAEDVLEFVGKWRIRGTAGTTVAVGGTGKKNEDGSSKSKKGGRKRSSGGDSGKQTKRMKER